ncbi:conserved hypothetical protein [Candida dubliniensis CD36]|uniref:MARVEL domain-containing protein n=1 Tax=Candida dubliniensis (strain CD36 / ATCC MYA-646 / CBS 7987 / NCPF 3949 / NRRL Y-17841) TaxID=573826 RepID=B9WHX2_CANDC|nr:conserved hypothetical protein [Candida dubliniensis CD36]CAX41767.1 conserved hypothetical protein [Candida dubliniensis CD36]
MSWKPIVTYIFRGLQTVFCIVVLGLSAGFLADVGYNYDRVTFALVVSILNLLYFGYILILMPIFFKNFTFSILIFAAEFIFFVFYLSAMGAIADVVPSGSCGDYGSYSSACSILKALIPFTLFNWLLFATTFGLFLGYSFIPQVSSRGFKSIFLPVRFEYGAIFTNFLLPFGKRYAVTDPVTDAAVADAEITGNDIENNAPKGASVGDDEATAGLASSEEDKYTEPLSGNIDEVTATQEATNQSKPYP